ncbi:RluA family pseudouridine synthase [Marinimicrobium alkaliphilum]|uniref:RluA family pseudouridine synthase n=1 Tax=Marinimicrobium alkaliphilum TaxID=2202654 RepID=UPI000DB9F614|nr:RluA family pseudouridine synthase [Marinimicrobium alkaliphilum]
MTHPPLAIVYADSQLLVVDKPSGLLTVPGKGPDKQDCLINRVLADYPNARIVHRLDQPTSGLVLIALSYPAQRALSMQFQARTVDKTYLAVVDGLVAEDQGSVELPLICDWPNRPRQKVDHEHGKAALTHYRVLERDHEALCTRVALSPVTGRSHQLRVHMLALGHPILGDQLYGDARQQAAGERLLLQARTIGFAHPATGDRLDLALSPAF